MATISVWQDKIILRTNEDIPESLIKYVKFNEKMNSHLLFFGAQNLKRIYQAYGKIPVTRGQERIDALKIRYSNFKEMEPLVRSSKCAEDFSSLRFKVDPLGKYQARGAQFLTTVKRAPLFAAAGVGKTWMVLVSTENQIRSGAIPSGKTLVCGKLMTLRTGWAADTKKFTDLKANIVWTKASSKRKQKLLEILNDPADIYIINHDGVFVLEDELTAMKFDKVVVDESTILKSYHGDFTRTGGKFGKALMRVAEHADWRVVMSGTPAPNGPEDLWGQLKFLDDCGFLLEPSYLDFRNTYMEEIVFGKDFGAPSKWFCPEDSIEDIKKIVDPYAFQVSIRENLDLPPLFVSERTVGMGDEQTAHYMEMYSSLSTIIDDETIDIDIKLTQLTKLRQITGGFLIDHLEDVHPIEDATKLGALDDLLEDIGDEKIIIYAQYQWEIETIALRYKDRGLVTVYGGNSSSNNLKNLDSFLEDPDTKIIVMHPRSAAHGITLTNSHYMIFYSISYSAEENYQCIARIERASQKNTMFVYYLLAEIDDYKAPSGLEKLAEKVREDGTIDEIIYGVVQHKQVNQNKLINQRDMNLSILKKF